MSGFYDVHTHILPWVDDGAVNLEEAMKLLKCEYQDGVRTIFATPHYRRKMFETSKVEIWKQYELVKKEALTIGSDLRILLGCELYANMDMIEMLDEKAVCTMGDTRCVLTEFSVCSELRMIQERCYELLSHGYEPIIAHAERYPVLNKHIDALEQLVDMGAYIQMNAGSIVGAEGFGVKRFCKKVIRRDLLHFVGSDAHDMRKRKPMIGKCSEYLTKVMGKEYMEKIMIYNPENMIEKTFSEI